MELIVNFSREDALGKQLQSIINFLKACKQDSSVSLDFSQFQYNPPLLTVFCAAFIERNKCEFSNITTSGYLSNLHFPNGLKPDLISDWQAVFVLYAQGNYLPLVNFSTKQDSECTFIRNDVLTSISKSIKKIADLPMNYYNALSYLISELTDNIVEHSHASRGWISFQYYPSKGYLDLCIADSGKGFLKSYQEYEGETDYSDVISHTDAIEAALQGESTKKEVRGYGLYTSKNMLIKGLMGKFVLLSGSGLLLDDKIIDIGNCYDGALALLRIPCENINRDFSAENYYE